MLSLGPRIADIEFKPANLVVARQKRSSKIPTLGIAPFSITLEL
jgi:hypothetical protein